MHQINLRINGMTCGGCAAGLKRRLTASDDVLSAEVNFATESAQICTKTPIGATEWVKRIQAAGFSVLSESRRYVPPQGRAVDPEHLASILTLPDVVSWHWHPGLQTLDITLLADTDGSALASVLKAEGWTEPQPMTDASPTGRIGAHWELTLAIGLTLPLVVQMGAMWLGLGWHLPPWMEWVLATPIQLWIGRRFYRGAWRALRRHEANMDTLVALGTSVAYGYSVIQWLTLGDDATGRLYFEAAAVVITLVLVGKAIETQAKYAATEALHAVMALRPNMVRMLSQGKECEVRADALRTGDVLVVRAGERIGADGVILKGEAEIDQQAMTGEPLPVYRSTGDSVISGTLVTNGQLRVRAERVGQASTVAQVADLVKHAQMGEAPIQQLVDTISRRFVPGVLILALLTYLGWILSGATQEFALIAAISVLVIACPCALGLATPTALVAGTGLAARSGILIKDIQTLEALPQLSVVAFDKTGTLTVGQPTVTAIDSVEANADAWLNRLVSVARESTHPLASAIVNAYPDRGVVDWQVISTDNTPGQGITVKTPEHCYRLGHWSFVAPTARPAAQDFTESAFSEDGTLLGSVRFADQTRSEAASVIASLKDAGLTIHMLTGDRVEVASRLGKALGIEQVSADLTPDAKIARIREFKAKGEVVGMVGDGINDGPALAAAHVGIALASGSDIALQSAPVVLMRADLRLIPCAIHYARQTRRIIRQNLGWAFGYNVLCIPLAMSGLLTPAIAGLAMALSSVSVVANSLRLKRMKPVIPNATG